MVATGCTGYLRHPLFVLQKLRALITRPRVPTGPPVLPCSGPLFVPRLWRFTGIKRGSYDHQTRRALYLSSTVEARDRKRNKGSATCGGDDDSQENRADDATVRQIYPSFSALVFKLRLAS